MWSTKEEYVSFCRDLSYSDPAVPRSYYGITTAEVRKLGSIVNKGFMDSLGVDRLFPSAQKVIFHDPATIVYWSDGTKTIVKCSENDVYSKETGLALCYMKRALLNSSRKLNDEIRKWCEE